MKVGLALFSLLILAACATTPREQTLVQRAAQAMGGQERLVGVRSLSAKGTLKQWEPEQSEAPGGDMRFGNEGNFEVVMNSQAARYDYEKRFAYPTPRTFRYSEIVTPQAAYVLGIDSNSRTVQSLKMNPPGHSMSAVRLAATQREQMRASATGLVTAMSVDPERLRPAVDLTIGGTAYPAVSYGPFIVAFDPQSGLPARVRTLDYDNIWGDVTYDVVFSDWRDAGGVRIPMHRTYELNGRVVQDVQLTDVRLNAPVDAAKFEVPAPLRAAGAEAPATGNVLWQWVIRRQFIGIYLDSDNPSYDARASQGLRFQELAPGVFHVVGGTHNSLLVEMSDHLVVVDAPVSDAQSLWVLNEASRRFPGKPVRWLVLTHHHMDHAGGLRAYLAQGATLVVGQGSREHFRRVLAAPIERNPDLKPHDFSRVPIMEVPESHVISDARGRQVTVYAMDNPHARGMLMAYVPEARLGFVADVWTPGPPLPPKPNPALLSVVKAVDRARIEPLRFAGGHGGVADYAPLAKLAGE